MLSGGQTGDVDGAEKIFSLVHAQAIIADKTYDADIRVIEPLQRVGRTVVTPSKRSRTMPRFYDRYLYKAHHLTQNFFCKLKQFRVIATRYDKTAPPSCLLFLLPLPLFGLIERTP